MLAKIFLGAAVLASQAYAADVPVFPYGAVYYRNSSPPEEDWARDHKIAAQLGVNLFRHWFLWSAIEIAPGKYDWRDSDRLMDLAASNGIKVDINEMVNAAPEWAFDQYPHARYRGSDDSVVYSNISVSSATGGFPGLCLDNDDVRLLAEKYLTAMVERYRNHPATVGWDLWSELSYPGGSPQRMYCYCEATQKKFREWLKAKYGTLEALERAWYRRSFADWKFVHPPRNLAGYPESLDWLEFRIENAAAQTRWRAEVIRRLDPKHKIIAQGVAGTLESLPSAAHNEWTSAAMVDIWGFTWVASRKGSEPWKQFHAVDLVRAGSRGKPFWHAQAQAGPLWMQPQVLNRPRDDGRVADEKDVRLWNLISCAGGATGIVYPRWRPLLDGPLFGAFGPMGMDGSITPRAEMAGRVARWANAHPDVWKSRPVKGDIGIVFVPESEIFNYVQQGNTNYYAQSARGAYQAFFDSNIQADFVSIDDISEYSIVYLPYPVMLKEATARKLEKYVERGGYLVSEGLPGYFGDRGRVGTVQPNLTLDKLFGAKESNVEFTPDILDDFKLKVRDSSIYGRFFFQEYAAAGGKPAGFYENGKIAAVENRYGKGKALLIGTFPGAGYYLHHSPEARMFFAGLLQWGEVEQQVRSSDPELKARLHTGGGGIYLWVANPTRETHRTVISLSSKYGLFKDARDVWQEQQQVAAKGRSIEVHVTDRNVAVVQLR
jgi:beta-galactosidase